MISDPNFSGRSARFLFRALVLATACTTGVGQVLAQPRTINGSFEEPRLTPGVADVANLATATIPGWETTAAGGVLEVWSDGFSGVQSFDGAQHIELAANQDDVGAVFQRLEGMAADEILEFSFAHRGRDGTDTLRLTITDLGANGVLGGGDDTVLFTGDYSSNETAWRVYSSPSKPAIVALGNPIRFAFEPIASSLGTLSFGNFIDAAALTAAVFADSFESSLVHRWSFNGSADDSAVGGNNAILLGGAVIQGNGVVLNGSGAFIELPIADRLADLDSFTFETWLTVNSVQDWARIFDFGTNNLVYFFSTVSSAVGANLGNPRSAITLGASEGEQRVSANVPFPTLQETHFALTLDGGSGLAIMYLDGTEVGRNNWSLSPADLGPLTNIWIGRSQFPTDPYLDAAINEFRIRDEALSPGQVQDSFLAGPDAP